MINLILNQSLQSAKSLITNFINSDNASDNLLTAFGNNFTVTTGLSILQSLSTEGINVPVEVIERTAINNANGAYSKSNNTIYLATELVEGGDVNAITKTLLEEIGHYVDNKVNSSDAPGDEGAIFASLVLGKELSSQQLELLQAEDDTAIVELDGASRAIEQDETIFVDANASGAGDGSSWENAYTSLQNALNSAAEGDEIWVADGTYRPTVTENRETSFVIPNNVKVYGGFAGGESELGDRSVGQNVAILSGDIGVPSNNADNSYNVVSLKGVESDTVLDGFTITGGNADGDISGSDENSIGGGIYAESSNATLANLIITRNNANSGAGMYSENSQHEITNVDFIANGVNSLLGGTGGGLATVDSTENIENVTFAYNVTSGNGGAINSIRSILDLDDVEFIANQASNYGGGVYNRESSFLLSNGVFLNNTASGSSTIGNNGVSRGGGIYNEGSDSSFRDNIGSSISDTIFQGNSADFGGGVFNDEIDSTVTNSLFTDNYSISGAGIYNISSNSEITNSTFTNNISQFASGVASEGRESDRTTITNSIFWDNRTTFERSPITNSNSTTEVSFSIVEGSYDGSEIINADPQFVDPNSFDYRLSSDSPALNSGNNDAVTEDSDLAENSRIAGDTVDLGAYEGAALDPEPDEPQIAENSSVVYVDGDASGDNNGTSWDNAYTNLRSALNNAPFGSQVWVAEGTYTPSQDDRDLSFQLKNAVAVYGGFDGSETSLSERDISANSTILSGEIGDSSTIEDNSYHVVDARNVTNSAILDGFTIRSGNSDGTGDALSISDRGGGIYSSNSHATFSNLRIENNQAENGGGIFIEGTSSHIFTNVDFVNNSSNEQGGAVFNERGNIFFFDSNFRNNTASEGGGAIFSNENSVYIEGAIFDSNQSDESGGAILLSNGSLGDNAPQKIVNSIFTNNTATQGGAIANAGGSEGVNLTFVNNEAEIGAAVYTAALNVSDLSVPEYYNSIFWNNTGTVEDDQIYNEFDPAIVSNSIVQGGYEGENIIDADPQFVDEAELRIRSNSPAVNTGLNNVVAVEEDIAERPRINEETVDIGAYEFTEGDNDSNTGGNDGDGFGDNDSNDSELQTIELFRFRNTTFDTGTYLFVGAGERDAIQSNPDLNQTFELEGNGNAAFVASVKDGDDLIPFYRLRSLDVPGTYLFVSTGEYDAIFDEDSNQRDKWIKEGSDDEGNDVAEFYLYDGSAERGTEFNRFQNTQNGTFLYTGPSETEAIENNPNLSSLFNNQGVAFESL